MGSGQWSDSYQLYQNTNTECFHGANETFSIDIDQTMYSLEGLAEGSEYLINLTLSIICGMEEILEEIVTANTATAG